MHSFFFRQSLDIDGTLMAVRRIGVIMIRLIDGNHDACFVKSETFLSLTMFIKEAFEPWFLTS